MAHCYRPLCMKLSSDEEARGYLSHLEPCMAWMA